MRLSVPDARELARRTPSRRLLELDLTRPLPEQRPTSPLAAARSRHIPTLRSLVDALDRAAEDDTVLGLVAHVGLTPPTFTQSSELREAVAAFGATGRPTVVWSESFGELGPGNVGYHLATAFDEVWLQPTGELGLVGIRATAVFLHDALDKLGVQAQLSQRHEYKSAGNTFTRSAMTEAHREMMQRLVDSATESLLGDVARSRGLSPQEVRAAVEVAPLTATEALERGLVDRLGYRHEVYAAVRTRLGIAEDEDLPTRYVQRQAAGLAERGAAAVRRHRPVVALVQASGGIHLGHGPSRGPSVSSDTLGAALRAAGEDDDVRAVVLRIDSPGGSYVASDALRAEVHALRRTGKPVVASMAGVAASGGYYIAMPCEEIVANPGTLTGSIGVLAGKQVLADGLGRLGIVRESVSSGHFADMFSTERPFDDEEWARLEGWLDAVYDDFTAKAATDRGMDVERLRELAKGRVWTGADAVANGLVDRLGGLSTAVDLACGRAGVTRSEATVRSWPRVGPWDRLRPPENSDAVLARGGLSLWPGGVAGASGSELGGMLEEVLTAAGLQVPGVLSLPWTWRLR